MYIEFFISCASRGWIGLNSWTYSKTCVFWIAIKSWCYIPLAAQSYDQQQQSHWDGVNKIEGNGVLDNIVVGDFCPCCVRRKPHGLSPKPIRNRPKNFHIYLIGVDLAGCCWISSSWLTAFPGIQSNLGAENDELAHDRIHECNLNCGRWIDTNQKKFTAGCTVLAGPRASVNGYLYGVTNIRAGAAQQNTRLGGAQWGLKPERAVTLRLFLRCTCLIR